MNKIICFGSAGKDIFFPTGEGKIIETSEELESQRKIAFELGSKIRINDRFEALGGCAANVSVGMRRLDLEASCISNVGSDLIGNWVIEELRKNEVTVDFMKIEEGRMSDLSAIIVDEKSADRVIFTNKNSSGKLNLNKEIAKNADWFFISDVHGEWEQQVESIVDLALSENKKIAFNPREVYIKENPKEIIETISKCEIVFLNKDEAIEIISSLGKNFSKDDLNSEFFLLGELKNIGSKVVALTDGENGAWATEGEKVFFAKSLKVPAVDSTGAGDAFCSGFLSAHIKEKEIFECLKWGIANSAHEVQYYGAIEGLLREEEILEETKKVEVEEI